jgi:hypothetical protein
MSRETLSPFTAQTRAVNHSLTQSFRRRRSSPFTNQPPLFLVMNRADAGPRHACKTLFFSRRPLLATQLPLPGAAQQVACDASTASSNHRPKSDIHNLAHRSSLAPATARELLPMATTAFACLIRWLHTTPRLQAKSGERLLTAGHPAGDDSRRSADVGVSGHGE